MSNLISIVSQQPTVSEQASQVLGVASALLSGFTLLLIVASAL